MMVLLVRRRRVLGLAVLSVVLAAALFASLAVGSNPLSLSEVVDSLRRPGSAAGAPIVVGQRLPRLALVVLVGAALAVAGALMQALTRNPLADPGILGVNAGASLAVVVAVAVVGATGIWFYLWFALGGAALIAVAVYVLGGLRSAGDGTSRLVLAGVAVSMAVSAFVQVVLMTDQQVFNEFRFWSAGSLEARGFNVVGAVAPFVVAGLVTAAVCAPGLNALALGDAAGAALGVNVRRLRALVLLAVTMLAGAATAAVGPVMFIGLGVPYLTRAICGPDLRWIIALSVLAGPLMLLVADLCARVVVAPQEIQTGIVTALFGGPVFIAVVKTHGVKSL
ncbi:FecCD family ABC transporter permease [Corynebacterium frankenforstense]